MIQVTNANYNSGDGSITVTFDGDVEEADAAGSVLTDLDTLTAIPWDNTPYAGTAVYKPADPLTAAGDNCRWTIAPAGVDPSQAIVLTEF